MTTLNYMRKKPGEVVDPVSIRLDPDQLVALDRLAAEERTSRAAVFRKLVDEGLRARLGGKAPPPPPRPPDPSVPRGLSDGLLEVAQRISEMVERYGSAPAKKPRAASR